ncbi:TIGR02587 family membrane protein [Calothrix sp. PCC 6303]|uniref:TIGR02587 family membrane protein n=1 Tax=Calothrix sp. PCC 6303 TaxID=1170562 RepID=UPI0002A0557C|nr:TIGR02587 family membrane protein [Calothrix sp. PCC 6303]AFZ04143.1 integral membrane protein TIGR02587 [Calothrix sp. PCC 6303]
MIKSHHKPKSKTKSKAWLREINDLIRGACGGFLFGIPLLYTMEVWWIGSQAKPYKLLITIALTFIAVYLINRTEGFRKYSRSNRPYEAAINTVEAMAIGILCSAFMMVLLQEVTFDNFFKESIGKVIFEGMSFTFGVALANQFLGNSEDSFDARNDTENNKKSHSTSSDHLYATLSDIGTTLIGATVIASNIAPTDEVTMLAASVSPKSLLLIVLTSLVITYSIVFQAGFSNQQKRRQQQGLFQRPSSETIMAYLISLLASAFMLWFFQKIAISDPWTMWLEQTLLLGLPASIGGAAGRLAI